MQILYCLYMLDNGVRCCGLCGKSLDAPGKWVQLKIESVDKRIFEQTLSSFRAFGFTFKQQADGSVTLDACEDCGALLKGGAIISEPG